MTNFLLLLPTSTLLLLLTHESTAFFGASTGRATVMTTASQLDMSSTSALPHAGSSRTYNDTYKFLSHQFHTATPMNAGLVSDSSSTSTTEQDQTVANLDALFDQPANSNININANPELQEVMDSAVVLFASQDNLPADLEQSIQSLISDISHVLHATASATATVEEETTTSTTNTSTRTRLDVAREMEKATIFYLQMSTPQNKQKVDALSQEYQAMLQQPSTAVTADAAVMEETAETVDVTTFVQRLAELQANMPEQIIVAAPLPVVTPPVATSTDTTDTTTTTTEEELDLEDTSGPRTPARINRELDAALEHHMTNMGDDDAGVKVQALLAEYNVALNAAEEVTIGAVVEEVTVKDPFAAPETPPAVDSDDPFAHYEKKGPRQPRKKAPPPPPTANEMMQATAIDVEVYMEEATIIPEEPVMEEVALEEAPTKEVKEEVVADEIALEEPVAAVTKQETVEVPVTKESMEPDESLFENLSSSATAAPIIKEEAKVVKEPTRSKSSASSRYVPGTRSGESAGLVDERLLGLASLLHHTHDHHDDVKFSALFQSDEERVVERVGVRRETLKGIWSASLEHLHEFSEHTREADLEESEAFDNLIPEDAN